MLAISRTTGSRRSKHAANIEEERNDETEAGAAQDGFEKEAPAARPALEAQTAGHLVSIAQRLAVAGGAGARARARAKSNEANFARDQRCGVEVHRSEQRRWPHDEHRLPSEKPDRIWAGAAAGGVWQSDNAGRTWRPLWRDHDSLNIGALAIDPKNPVVIYCGTGEANLSVDSYAGVGIYRTRNGGKTWKLLASSDETGVPTRIGVIAIDPFNSKHLRVGGVGQRVERTAEGFGRNVCFA